MAPKFHPKLWPSNHLLVGTVNSWKGNYVVIWSNCFINCVIREFLQQIKEIWKKEIIYNLIAMQPNAGLEEAQAGIKIAGRNINNLRYADDTTLMAETEEELKSLLMKVKGRVKKLA